MYVIIRNPGLGKIAHFSKYGALLSPVFLSFVTCVLVGTMRESQI